jgi:pimeloyl-ACP methyl ester carboxylesterase
VLDSLAHGAPRDVVLVHGAGGNNLVWSRTLQRLSGSGRALAVNLPGHPSGEMSCGSVAEYSDSLLRYIEDAGLDAPVVCGHSMGSAVCLTLAIEHPREIGGLILVGAGAKLGVGKGILEGLRDQPMRAVEQTITPMSFYSMDLGAGREARAALSFTNLPVFLNDYMACAAFDERGRLSKVDARTLVVCGDRDRMTPPRWSHFLHANIVDSELYFVKDSGHMLPLEKPQALAALVQRFLEGFNR